MGGQAAQVMVESETLKLGWQRVKFSDVVRLSNARCSDPAAEGIKRYVRKVKRALRKTLFKYQLHQDTELFEKAYSYIRQYY